MTAPTEAEIAAVVYHGPPMTRYKDTAAAATEGTDAIDKILDAAGGRFLAVADWNSHVVPLQVAHRHAATLYGHAIDAAVAAGLDVVRVDYVRHVAGIRLGTDHPHGALRLVVKRRGRLLARRRVVWFYNVRVGRPGSDVRVELGALLTAPRTFAVFLVETTGYDLPGFGAFELVRDRSSESRANVAAYVRRGHIRFSEWVDLEKTWKATDHPGQHAPRSLLVLVIGWARA